MRYITRTTHALPTARRTQPWRGGATSLSLAAIMPSDPNTVMPPGPAPRRTLLLGLAGALAALFMIGIGSLIWLTQGPDGVIAVGGPFNLVDQDNRPVTEKTWRGRHMLVFFGFTFCPDVCPTTLNQVADAMDRLGPKADRVCWIMAAAGSWCCSCRRWSIAPMCWI